MVIIDILGQIVTVIGGRSLHNIIFSYILATRSIPVASQPPKY